jgi:predicted benzoate:H+ symporter BenE
MTFVHAVSGALVAAGTIVGIVGIVLCARDRSEVGTKWVGVGLAVLGLGTLLYQLL